jgi:hypothetical protein
MAMVGGFVVEDVLLRRENLWMFWLTIEGWVLLSDETKGRKVLLFE